MEEKSLWHIERVSPEEYKNIVPDRRIFFNEPDFIELNKNKADDVYYLIFMRENSARFGLVAGRIGNEMRTPFSAPYSYPVAIINESKQETIDISLELYEEYCKSISIDSIRFILPPLFYDEHLLSGWISALYRAKYEIADIDLNFSLDLKKLNVDEETYGNLITQKGRKGLRRAERAGLEIIRCETEDEYREAYRIVQIGHEAKGFPVHLTYEQLSETLKLVDHDVFIVKKDGIGIVAEFLYVINSKIVQGIYTGSRPDYLDCNGLNLLTYHTIRYYGDKGYSILDKATAGKDSEPMYGLCNFKESVGCERSLKFTFRKNLPPLN